MISTYKITITGQVQGVGFRPHVYLLAHKYQINGSVSNNEFGVIIYLNGSRKQVDAFLSDLINNPPPVAKILSYEFKETKPKVFDRFEIVPSDTSSRLNLQLTPDFAICESCKSDISDPENRRYKYPFTTCVNCGPRWSLTTMFPFERENTSMDDFDMCEACVNEYINPADRRFHSQTNSCQACGISLKLLDNSGNILGLNPAELFQTVAKRLLAGDIVAIKNTAGYLLCCHAGQTEVVKRLRARKKRPRKPFAVMYPSLQMLESDYDLSVEQRDMLTSVECPIVIVKGQNKNGSISEKEIAPGLNQMGIMLPYTGVLFLLARELDFPIVATSGNIHGSPILSKNENARSALAEVADLFLEHNLEITHPQDDSVIKFTEDQKLPVIFRRSRGYAPSFSDFQFDGDIQLLALGAHLKSAIALLPNDYLYLSQYLGNLDNFEVYDRFVDTTRGFLSLFQSRPDFILTDSHPSYQSTLFGRQLAHELSIPVVQVQHHKAHFVAVLAENDLLNQEKPVLGVVWDGTGFGDDNQIWGGEFFKFAEGDINRINHFEYFNWLAGDKMSKEPRLSLLSIFPEISPELIKRKFSEQEIKIYKKLLQVNTLKTSSVGRLFDAVASLLGLCDINTYEGEAAILLESLTDTQNMSSSTSYINPVEEGISGKQILRNIVADLDQGISREKIAQNFLFTLTEVVFRQARKSGVERIAFSGGVFQNTTLVDMLIKRNSGEFELYFHRKLSPNDENIAYGQIHYFLNDFHRNL